MQVQQIETTKPSNGAAAHRDGSSAIQEGTQAQAELDDRRADVNRLEKQLAAAESRRLSAADITAHSAAHAEAEWASTCLERARAKLEARETELGPMLSAKAVAEAEARVEAAHKLHLSFREQLKDKSAAVAAHIEAIQSLCDELRAQADEQERQVRAANSKIGKYQIPPAPVLTAREAFAFLAAAVRPLLGGGLTLTIPAE